MRKTVFICEREDDPVTGGQKYDQYFIKKLKMLDKNLFTISDSNLKYSKSFISFFYNILYFMYWKTLSEADILIVNSRLYPRLFFFISVFQLFSKKKTKIFAIHHHYNFMTHIGLKRRIHKFFEMNFLKKMNGLIIPSKYVLQTTKKRLPNMKTEFIEIAFETKRNKAITGDLNNLVFVGKIERRKGLHLLLNSIKNLDYECKIDLIGTYSNSDKYYLELKELINNLSLEESVIFHGRLNEDNMKKILEKSSVFVFPSLHEGYGMVMMEAMSYGLPIVAFNNSSIPFVVKDKYNGLIAENEDILDFAKKINQLLNDKKLYNELSNNAKNTYLNCRKHVDIDRDIELFHAKYLK